MAVMTVSDLLKLVTTSGQKAFHAQNGEISGCSGPRPGQALRVEGLDFIA
jgi:hypothetical protein